MLEIAAQLQGPNPGSNLPALHRTAEQAKDAGKVQLAETCNSLLEKLALSLTNERV